MQIGRFSREAGMAWLEKSSRCAAKASGMRVCTNRTRNDEMGFLSRTAIAVVAVVSCVAVSATADTASNFKDLVTKTDSSEYEVDGALKIDHEKALEFLNKGSVFVDARRTVQYNAGHIPGAINLELNSKMTEENLAELASKNECVVFYCSDRQCYRSAHASAMAISWGYTKVAYFADGWLQWDVQKYPREQ